MAQALRLLVRRGLQLNVLLSVGAASIVATATLLAGGSVGAPACIVAFASVFGLYNFDRIADDTPAEGKSTPKRRSVVLRLRHILRVLIVLALLTVVAVSLCNGVAALAMALAFPLLGIAYVLPLLPFHRARRVKDVPYAKSFYVPVCWCCFVGVALVFAALPVTSVVACFVGFVFLRLFVSGYLGDIRDAEDDAVAGVRTVARALGAARSHRLLKALHLASAVLVIAAVALSWMPLSALGLLAAAAVGFAAYLAYERRPQDHELIFEIYDLELVLYAPCVLFAAVG